MPLIVNTQGWMKGLGEELLRAIELMVEPTHVFNFEVHEIDQESQPPSAMLSNGTVNLEAVPVTPLQARHTAADFRILSMISYLRTNFNSNWDFSSLSTQVPWRVKLGVAVKHVILIGEGADGTVEEDLPLALNGSVVALLEADDLDGPLYVQGRPYPSLDECNFLGLAIVRGLHELTLHLITPLSPDVLAKAKILVKNGAMELPLCAIQEALNDGVRGTDSREVPFLDAQWIDVPGGERRRFRRNLQRKGM